jgi:hypothetical protein
MDFESDRKIVFDQVQLLSSLSLFQFRSMQNAILSQCHDLYVFAYDECDGQYEHHWEKTPDRSIDPLPPFKISQWHLYGKEVKHNFFILYYIINKR